MNYLPCVEVESATPATATVIWLHGLGADGHDFEPIVPELKLPAELAVRFIFPHAPSIPVTINNGDVMPAWYDILSIDFEREVDEEQLLASAADVQALIDREIERGIDSTRIVIAGFSQGGAVGYQAALSYKKPLAGLLAMSTYFATVNIIDVYPANEQLPIEIHHGSNDSVVPEQLAINSLEYLKMIGFKPNYTSYPMDHSVCLEQINNVSEWLQKTLA
jgi:phospholipase/carboxylesterase